MDKPRVSMVAAIGRRRELGTENELVWRIPDDLKRFKTLTTGHPIIMGRKTFDSIGRPLPNRTNIVITRDAAWTHKGVVTAASVEDALAKGAAAGQEEIFVIGGGQIYTQALPHADRLYLTLIDAEKEADAFFPEYEHLFTKKLATESREHDGLKYSWVDLERAT